MSLLDIFKKKPEEQERKKPKAKMARRKRAVAKKEEVKEKTEPEIKVQKTESVATRRRDEKIAGDMGWVFKSPQISEKAGFLAEKNQYIFKVSSRANKTNIKKAVEGIFGVNVMSVRVINVPGKERRVGRTIGFKKGYKKAMIKIKEGQKIEVLPR